MWLLTLVIVAAALFLLWATKCTSLLKDPLLPQLAPKDRTFSLARVQMAWWFLIILLSSIYVFCWIVGQANPDFPTVLSNFMPEQAVMLMGLAAVTAGAAAAVDTTQTTTEDDANTKLQDLKLYSYKDVAPLEKKADQKTLDADEQTQWTAYQDVLESFKSQGWYNDLLTDSNGIALYRVQALIWTLVIGTGYTYLALQGHEIPTLDNNLLAVMGVSSAGYVGFKYNDAVSTNAGAP